MNALEYAKRFVYFWQSSPIAGGFDDSRYPFCRDVLLALDDIDCKTMVLYGPTQSFKTACLQIATAYRLDVKRKSVMAVAQTDDDAGKFHDVKLEPFLSRIPSLANTMRKGAYAKKTTLWKWATHELIITGPGLMAQQSDSVCYLHSDEAHVWNRTNPGAMASLDNRMGLRWDRNGFHATTAAEAGTEIDIAFHKGRQNEWHLRCPHCNGLFQPLWTDASRKQYNGHEVFTYKESQSETETLDSLRMHCPHCQVEIQDAPRVRADMDSGARYIASNPQADKSFNSFRWNAFAPRWKAWRDLLAIFLKACHSAKLGDLSPYSDWLTKQEVRTDFHEFPMLGDSTHGRNYNCADVSLEQSHLRTCSFDVQEGTAGEGFHLWGQVDQWQRNGDSKRVAYRRLATWSDARAFQLEHHVADKNTAVDFGHRDREVFAACAKYHWLSLKSGDEENFRHAIHGKNNEVTWVAMPYSETRAENPMTGKETGKVVIPRGRKLPNGFAISRLWSKPAIYPILFALKSGTAGREYGIARDINPEYVEQLHSYIPAIDLNEKTNTPRGTLWKKVKHNDHAFITSAQNLILALIAGYYPMSKTEPDIVSANITWKSAMTDARFPN